MLLGGLGALYFLFQRSPLGAAVALLLSIAAVTFAQRDTSSRERALPARSAALGLVAGLGVAGLLGAELVQPAIAPWLAVGPLCLAGALLQGPLLRCFAIASIAAILLCTPDTDWTSRISALLAATGGLFVASRYRSLQGASSAPRAASSRERSWVKASRSTASVMDDDDGRLMRDASRMVRESVDRSLSVLRAAMRGRTVVVIWLDSRDRSASVRAAETSEKGVTHGPFGDREGILAVLHQQPAGLLLSDRSGEELELPWYTTTTDRAHIAGCGIYEEGMLVGFLVADRAATLAAFDDIDLHALKAAATNLVSTMHTERLLVDAARSRREATLLYEAADALNSALTTDEVCAIAERLIKRIAPVETFVITRFDEDAERHVVLRATGPDAVGLVDHEFADDGSLAPLALRRRHILPYSGRLENSDTPVFGRDYMMPRAESILIFPLEIGHRPIGTCTLAALSNALAYAQMVHRATTDGMTGLLNHRTFKERGAEAFERANRTGRPMSLIMCDIDHFKRINDTYGHAVGDDVIRSAAVTLRACLRRIDLGARYGGEEFAILLEETDHAQALVTAERLRQAVAALEFTADQTQFRATISLGVASIQPGTETLLAFIEAADAALYDAKRAGRNRVASAARLKAAA
jgi:diguanylate cyclase (GGDEF)-like protein